MKYITVIPAFTPNQFSSKAPCSKVSLNRPNHRFYRYGRDALWVGMGGLGLGPGDEILVPGALCDVVLIAMIKRGVGLQYYRLNSMLIPDLGEIEARIGPKTRAIYVNHYFGRPTRLESLRRLCDVKGLFLIEDCAHALGAHSNGLGVGNTGDIAIFSYRKFFPILDGGGLLVNSSEISMPEPLAGSGMTTMLRGALKILMLSLAELGVLPIARCKSVLGDVDAYLSVDDTINIEGWAQPFGGTALSRWMIEHADLKDVIGKRREHYQYLSDCISTVSNAVPLFPDLDKGQVPFCFPILLKNRDALVRYAAKRGVYLEPTLAPPYRNISALVNRGESFPDIDNIAAQLVSIPVHQTLTKLKLARVWSVIKCGLEKI